DLAAGFALDLAVLVVDAADTRHRGVGQLPDLGARVDPGGFADLLRAAAPHPIEVGEADLQALVAGTVSSSATCHQPITPASACGEGSDRSPIPARGGG